MTEPLFSTEETIPDKWRISVPLEQRHYLCDGELKEWSGPRQDVLSPVCESVHNSVKQKRLGSYPLLEEQQSLEALDAACRAYDHGLPAPLKNELDISRHSPTG